jgi:PKD repeat protein
MGFGNGNTVTTKDAKVTYATAGTFVLKLTGTASSGCSDTKSINVMSTAKTKRSVLTNECTQRRWNDETDTK